MSNLLHMANENWRTIKIPKELAEQIESIMTKEGFNNKADFINQAIRELLQKYTNSRLEYANFDDDVIRLIDNHKPRGTPFVEIVLNGKELHCKTCQSKACEHIEHAWKEPKIKRQLKEKGLKPA